MRAIVPPIVFGLLLIPASAPAQEAEEQPEAAAKMNAQPEAMHHRPSPGQEVVIYRDRNFGGPALTIPRDEPNLRLGWPVNSARVRGGTWQLCERANYQGPCLTLSQNTANLGHRRVQSARLAQGWWREIGRVNVYWLGWTNTTIDAREHPAVSFIRLCAEQTAVRLHVARARFTNGLFQNLRVPSQLQSGRCTDPLPLTGPRRNLRSVELTVSSVGVARGRVRLEGR